MDVAASDADLVRRIGSGQDHDAEGEFCRRMARRVRLYGLRHLRDTAAADDLVQQVLVTTLQALRARRLREPDKVASFVLGTCRMTVLDIRRNGRRHERLLGEFGKWLESSVEPEAPHLESERLAACTQALAERERTVIVLTFYDERDAADVAGVLGVSDGNVRVIRHRALHRLRACLGVAS